MSRTASALRLAWSLLVHDPRRFLLSMGGVAFSTLALFTALGFFNGMNDSQGRVATVLNGDLILYDSRTRSVTQFHSLGRADLARLRAEEGVREVVPVYTGSVRLRNPQTEMLREINYFAFPPESRPFLIDGMDLNNGKLRNPGTILYDRYSRSFFGDIEEGMELELGPAMVTVAGTVAFGPNFGVHGYVMMSDATMASRMGHRALDRIAFGIVRVDPGVDVDALRRRLQGWLPSTLDVVTNRELAVRELWHNVRSMPIGALLAIGLIVAMFVGVVVTYQILYAEITDHLDQFATLKAIGFESRFLSRVVLAETVLLCVLGFLPGVGASLLFYEFIESRARITMFLNVSRVGSVFALTLLMCLIAGVMVLGRLEEADPADLY